MNDPRMTTGITSGVGVELADTATSTQPQMARSTYIASQTFAPAQTNTLAIVALVSGVAGLFLLVPVLGPLVALATGYIARRQITARRQGGRRLADAGVVLGWAGLALTGAVICALVLFPWT